MRTGGQQDHLGVEAALAVGGVDHHPVRTVQPAATDHQFDPFAQHPITDVRGLLLGQRQHPLVHRRQIHVHKRLGLWSPAPSGISSAESQPQLGRLVDLGHHLGRGDQRLGRDAVGQHRGTTEAVGVDQGHLTP
jgi:hypothetical protein